MADSTLHMVCYMIASTLVLAALIWGITRTRAWGHAPLGHALKVAVLISVIGILVGKYGANYGLPWYVYYTAPLLATVLVPPLIYHLGLLRGLIYMVLAFLAAPAIHFVFVKLVGWTDYMPFLKV
jgi:hypothetical protein